MKNLTEENFCDVVVVADKYDDKTLMSKAQHFFNKKKNEIFATSEWNCLLANNYYLAGRLMVEMIDKKN